MWFTNIGWNFKFQAQDSFLESRFSGDLKNESPFLKKKNTFIMFRLFNVKTYLFQNSFVPFKCTICTAKKLLDAVPDEAKLKNLQVQSILIRGCM